MLLSQLTEHTTPNLSSRNTNNLAHKHEVLYKLNKQSLLFYPSKNTTKEPILLIPSIINKAYILDLHKNFSLVDYLNSEGHPVYLIDWGTPTDEDQFIEFDDFIGTHLHRHVKSALRHSNNKNIGLVGYCMGGTLATIYTCLHPENVKWLVNLLAPIDFSKAGMLADWTSKESFNADLLIQALGNMDPGLMQTSFQMMRPLSNISKFVKQTLHPVDPESKEFFDRLEEWAWDNIPFPGTTYTKYIKDLYQDNLLVKGEFTIHGKPIHLNEINCPTLAISADRDHIVPVESANAMETFIQDEFYSSKTIRGGHVAVVVGPKSKLELWPYLTSWIGGQ